MKTSSSILLSLLAIFLQGSCADIYKHTASNYCVVNEADPNSWLNCDGKVVKVKGNLAAPAEIMQHPMLDTPPMLAPSMDESAALIKRTVQNYMNVGDRQIILLSDTFIECMGDMEVIGTLESVSLGGAPGTKNSYKGWSIRASEYQCF